MDKVQIDVTLELRVGRDDIIEGLLSFFVSRQYMLVYLPADTERRAGGRWTYPRSRGGSFVVKKTSERERGDAAIAVAQGRSLR